MEYLKEECLALPLRINAVSNFKNVVSFLSNFLHNVGLNTHVYTLV